MTERDPLQPALARELEYHERLYAGFAQRHFARPAVRALRAHMVEGILRATGAGARSRVLSLGCGIGDTEILMAPRVREITGVDFSPAAIRQARCDAEKAGIPNICFLTDADALPPLSFDLVIGIFFLHHLPEPLLNDAPRRIHELLAPGGKFYSLDPSSYRLSGAVGFLLFPRLMRKYHSPNERELDAAATFALFAREGFACEARFYDFVSSPLAGILPGWRAGYRAARRLDDLLVRLPLLCRLGSNFELIAAKPL